jgi:predicted RNA binding protein YcfA (HicA-like mRNA interferase family)
VKVREINVRIEAAGVLAVRQRGRHRLYLVAGQNGVARTVVPQHSAEVLKGTARKIERDLEPVLGKGWLLR